MSTKKASNTKDDLRKEGSSKSSSESDLFASKAREMAEQSNEPSQNIGSQTSGSGVRQRRASGTHRKNVEGNWDESKAEDGLKKALESEPGSMDDPSRLAEHRIQLQQGAHGRDAGPRQDKLEGKTAYDALGSEVSS